MFLFFWTHSPSVSLSRASVVGKRENSSKDGIRHWKDSFNFKWYVDKQLLRRTSFQTELIYFPCTIILLSTNCVMRDKNAVMFGNQRRSLIEENCKQQERLVDTNTNTAWKTTPNLISRHREKPTTFLFLNLIMGSLFPLLSLSCFIVILFVRIIVQFYFVNLSFTSSFIVLLHSLTAT